VICKVSRLGTYWIAFVEICTGLNVIYSFTYYILCCIPNFLLELETSYNNFMYYSHRVTYLCLNSHYTRLTSLLCTEYLRISYRTCEWHLFTETGMVVHKACVEKAKDMQGGRRWCDTICIHSLHILNFNLCNSGILWSLYDMSEPGFSYYHILCNYSAPVGELSIVISWSVCLSVHDRWTDLHKFFVQIPCGYGSVLWWHCDVLCTSGFMDDVTFGHNGPYGDEWKAEPLTYYH